MFSLHRLTALFLSSALAALSITGCTTGPVPATCCSGSDAKIKVKVVVVTMFEVGEDTGDTPGEFQFWVEREHLIGKHELIGGGRPVREGTNGVIGISTGEGNISAAASITALGLDPRYDLTHAYWIVAGIAGVDPADASLGSAIWAERVVDGDLAHEIDAREIPANWPDGFAPLGTAKFDAAPVPESQYQTSFTLDAPLVHWAYHLTKDVPLIENDRMKFNRSRYTGFPNAQRSPFVLLGDNLAGSTFWHGARMNAWANRWVKLQTGGAGNYVSTAMEDSGTLEALTRLSHSGKVDVRRALVLRTASNFDMPPPGLTAAESMAEENGGAYSAYIPSLEAAHSVGSKVVHELVNQWPRYEKEMPQ